MTGASIQTHNRQAGGNGRSVSSNAATARPGTRAHHMRSISTLAAACAVGAAPGEVGLTVLEHARTGHPVVSASVGWGALGVGAAVAAMVAVLLRNRVSLRPWWRAVPAMWISMALLAVTTVLLARLAPFRLGLLSVLLYAAPPLPGGAALHARRPTAMVVLLAAAGVMPVAVAHPIAVLQQHVAATQWMHAQGVTSRQMAQDIDLPDLVQEPYQYDRASGQLTAVFQQDEGWLLPPIAIAAETVTPGDQPCAPVLVASGDAQDQQTPQDCQTSDDGLWQLDLGNSTAGFARETNGVTLSVAGPQEMAPVLRRALLAAQPADDAQLFARIEPGPFTVTDWLLL